MHLRSLLTRRPSPALVVASAALFISLGGVGYAFTSLPRNSVGTSQLRNASVTNHKIKNGSVGNFKLAFNSVGARKIINGAVGKNQIDSGEVQARVSGVCSAGAVTGVGSSGTVTCGAAPGADLTTSNPSGIPITTGATTIDTAALPGGTAYLVTANPYIAISAISGASVNVEIDCTLAAGTNSAATQTRSIIAEIGSHSHADTIPLSVLAPSTPSASTATLSCSEKVGSGSQTPATTALTSINALQVGTATSEPYAG